MGVWIKLYPLQYRRSCLSFRKRTKTLLPRMPFFERLWGTIVALLTQRNNKKTAKRAESAICRFDDRQATFAFHRRSACWNTRSEERRGGKGWVRKGRSRWSPYN